MLMRGVVPVRDDVPWHTGWSIDYIEPKKPKFSEEMFGLYFLSNGRFGFEPILPKPPLHPTTPPQSDHNPAYAPSKQYPASLPLLPPWPNGTRSPGDAQDSP